MPAPLPSPAQTRGALFLAMKEKGMTVAAIARTYHLSKARILFDMEKAQHARTTP